MEVANGLNGKWTDCIIIPLNKNCFFPLVLVRSSNVSVLYQVASLSLRTLFKSLLEAV